jgi:hypothetical protein
MCGLRALALCAGFLLSFVVIGCGMNPQPEPPSADELTSGAAGAPAMDDPGPIDGVGPSAARSGDAAPEPEPDAGSNRAGEHYAADDSNNAELGDSFANGSPKQGSSPNPEDAGARDAEAQPPPEDAGLVAY